MSTASEILRTHGIARHARLSDYTTRCPQCSAQRSKKTAPCLSVLIDNKGVRFNCHHCGWHGWQFFDGTAAESAKKSGPDSTLSDRRERNARSAARIWAETVPLAGTLGARYLLEHRGLDVSGLELDDVLRWHSSDRMIVARQTDVLTAEPCGVHRTYLRPDGSKAKPTRGLGPWGPVRLSPDADVTMALGLVEGIEDGLAVISAAGARFGSCAARRSSPSFPCCPKSRSRSSPTGTPPAWTLRTDAPRAGRRPARRS